MSLTRWWKIGTVPLFCAFAFTAFLAWALWPDGGAGPSIQSRAAESVRSEGLAARVIASGDLPPEGTRSLFDHLIAQNESLPYPFEKLVALVQAQDPEGRPPVALLIPRGRSLLKAQADFARPRVLLAADAHAPNTAAALGVAARGQLFFGFVEDAAEIEVISYNEAAGRFEFQLVQDYREGGVPRIVYARRAVCTTCHQGGAPIFPQRPWSETNAQPAIAARISDARGPAPYMTVPVAVPLAVPERFDELTDVGNFIPVAQRIWLDGCGEGAGGRACRREMLRLAVDFAIEPGAFDGGTVAGKLRELQAAAWPAGGIGVPDGDLRNRDPLAERPSTRAWLRDLVSRALPERTPRSNEDLDQFERLPKLPPELDPVQPRAPKRVLTAAVFDGVFALAQFFTPADARLIEQHAADREARARAVARIPDAEFDGAPFARVRLLNALLVALRQPPRAYALLDTRLMSPPQALGVPPLELAEGSVLQPYARYCFACHRGNPSARLDFMSGADEAAVLENLRTQDKVREVLDWERYRGTDKAATLMPPADSHQHRELQAALVDQPQLLEEMRKVVPALFDF
ncbi:MAG TPA: hypothetical protein VM240_06895 [Verrucomicrobiae bacterium]|nr:hypothetical protein [Verrucomicrobiae bacterium]